MTTRTATPCWTFQDVLWALEIEKPCFRPSRAPVVVREEQEEAQRALCVALGGRWCCWPRNAAAEQLSDRPHRQFQKWWLSELLWDQQAPLRVGMLPEFEAAWLWFVGAVGLEEHQQLCVRLWACESCSTFPGSALHRKSPGTVPPIVLEWELQVSRSTWEVQKQEIVSGLLFLRGRVAFCWALITLRRSPHSWPCPGSENTALAQECWWIWVYEQWENGDLGLLNVTFLVASCTQLYENSLHGAWSEAKTVFDELLKQLLHWHTSHKPLQEFGTVPAISRVTHALGQTGLGFWAAPLASPLCLTDRTGAGTWPEHMRGAQSSMAQVAPEARRGLTFS